MDIKIFVEGEELVERPTFKDVEDVAQYMIRIAEGRDIAIVLEHPHSDDCVVLSAWIGTSEDELPQCPYCTHG